MTKSEERKRCYKHVLPTVKKDRQRQSGIQNRTQKVPLYPPIYQSPERGRMYSKDRALCRERAKATARTGGTIRVARSAREGDLKPQEETTIVH